MSNSNRGFTLIEVMVALAILGAMVASFSLAAGQALNNAGRLEDRQFGQWVVDKAIVELAINGDLQAGTSRESVTNFGRDWDVESRILELNEGLYEVTVSAYAHNGGQQLATATTRLADGVQ